MGSFFSHVSGTPRRRRRVVVAAGIFVTHTAAAVDVGYPCGGLASLTARAEAAEIAFVLFFDKTGSTSVSEALVAALGARYVDTLCHATRETQVLPGPEASTRLVWWRWAMQGGFDECARLRPRPCAYATVVRDPVARLASAYAYFCRNCAEHGRQCGGREDPGVLRCPHMSLGAYAHAFQDLYVRAFSHADSYWPLLALGEPATPSDYDKAKSWIRRWHVVVVFAEDFDEPYPLAALAGPLGAPSLAELRELPHANPGSAVAARHHHHHHVHKNNATTSMSGGGAPPRPPGGRRRRLLEGPSDILPEELADAAMRYVAWDRKFYRWLREEYAAEEKARVEEPPPGVRVRRRRRGLASSEHSHVLRNSSSGGGTPPRPRAPTTAPRV